MNVLLLFDSQVDRRYLKKICTETITSITLFPLTSDAFIVSALQKELKSFTNIDQILFQSARDINEEVNHLQKNIHEWSCIFGEYQIGRKKLKKWFLLPDGKVSSWWFSLISEKNTNQNQIFFDIAQMNAVKKHLQNHQYDHCVVMLNNRQKQRIIITLLQKIQMSFFANRIKVKPFFNLILLMKSLTVLGKWLIYSWFIKYKFFNLNKRIPAANPFLFVSYFPNVEADAANKGIFRNKYALALQDKFKELNIPITWLLMPVAFNNYNLKSAIDLAKLFAKNGERILILYEFFNIKLCFKAFYWWLKQCVVSIFIYFLIDKKKIISIIADETCSSYINHLWMQSFIGPSAMRGILFYLTYQEAFKKIPKIKKCLYYCEMQAWEKALNAAKMKVNSDIVTVGFQHTFVMKNNFNYFYHTDETKKNNLPTDLPLPDVFIVNSRLMASLFEKCQYNQLEVEAIRHFYLRDVINKQPPNKLANRKILLVAGSFDKTETKSLITIVYSVFPQAKEFDIWFKGYPYTPISPILRELKIDAMTANYKVFYEDIGNLLAQAHIVFVPSSSVAIEALAYGCTVIVPCLADKMQLNPLVDYETGHHIVYSAEEFRLVVEKEIQEYSSFNKAAGQFLQTCWHLDKDLKRWQTVLEIP